MTGARKIADVRIIRLRPEQDSIDAGYGEVRGSRFKLDNSVLKFAACEDSRARLV